MADRLNGCAAIQRDFDNSGEMGREEPHEVHEQEMLSPALGRNNPRHQVRLGRQVSGKELCSKGAGEPDGH